MLEIEWIDQRKEPAEQGPDEFLKQVGEKVVENEGIQMDVSVCVTLLDPEEMRRLNAQFRKVDSVTDVLSFPMIEGRLRDKGDRELTGAFDPETGCLFLGDLLFCPERIAEQAKEYGHSERREYGYMLAHGLLHLLGYDHETDEQRAEMRELEEKALLSCGLTRE